LTVEYARPPWPSEVLLFTHMVRHLDHHPDRRHR
jgi:hypothetical protein